jgi:hypothetical protein
VISVPIVSPTGYALAVEEYQGAQSGQRDTAADNNLSQEVAARSNQRRRTSSFADLLSLIGTAIGALGAVISVIALFPSLLPSNDILVISIAVGVAAIIISIILLWYNVGRWRRPRRFYTSEKDILDNNLRKLISGIAKSQIEFERRLAAMNRSSLPKS